MESELLPRVKSPNSGESHTTATIDVAKDKYPYCIVWTPIPLIRSVPMPLCYEIAAVASCDSNTMEYSEGNE